MHQIQKGRMHNTDTLLEAAGNELERRGIGKKQIRGWDLFDWALLMDGYAAEELEFVKRNID
ncbi:MAG: hypothetical protein J4F31_08090 [Flavobacteriales bacterium]|nr:hypothetical protein [Flavobacteriales bacterium]